MYKYKVYGHDGIDYFNETGITVAASYQDAMKNLSDYYDDDSIINIKLYFITDDSVIPLPDDIPNKILKSLI